MIDEKVQEALDDGLTFCTGCGEGSMKQDLGLDSAIKSFTTGLLF